MEYYTSEDILGQKVQKLRLKKKKSKSGLTSIQERGRQKNKSQNRKSDESKTAKSKLHNN